MIFKAKNSAEIIEKLNISEDEAIQTLPNLNHTLVIVKIGDDYLLGYHKWRDDWETFGGLIEDGESLRECIERECEEELGIRDMDFKYLGIVHYYMPPDYWNKEWHEEYGGLYGITLSKEMLEIIEENRHDKDEIGEIGLYSELKAHGKNIDEINEQLLEFF